MSEVMASDAQKTALINHQSMEKKTKTIRLIYPQWQGASIVPLIPEVKNPDDASRGYFLGAQLLNFLAPDSGQETLTVPVSIELEDRQVTDGVLDRDIIVRQTRTALDMLRVSNPDKIVTLGGECSVSVVPFTYLAEKYDNDVAVIWIDAHPDITLPGDVYPGYHAMAVTACMGYGDKRILEELPAKISPSKILLVGLRNWERDEIKERQQQYGIKHLSPQNVAQNSDAIKSWLKACGASKVVIHFDMDALDPAEIIAAVGTDPDGMKMEEVIRVINDIAAEKEFGIPEGRTLIMAALESARGIMKALDICEASERLFGIALSGGDYTKDLQTHITGTGVELMGARQNMVIAARAAGVQCFDTVYTDLDNMEGFKQDVETIHLMGFDGKSIINPRQIEIVHEIYTPTQKDIIFAEKVVKEIDDKKAKGIGVFTVDGKMIDIAFYDGAKRTIELAKASGVYKGDL